MRLQTYDRTWLARVEWFLGRTLASEVGAVFAICTAWINISLPPTEICTDIEIVYFSLVRKQKDIDLNPWWESRVSILVRPKLHSLLLCINVARKARGVHEEDSHGDFPSRSTHSICSVAMLSSFPRHLQTFFSVCCFHIRHQQRMVSRQVQQ